jgi:hypothetical protein
MLTEDEGVKIVVEKGLEVLWWVSYNREQDLPPGIVEPRPKTDLSHSSLLACRPRDTGDRMMTAVELLEDSLRRVFLERKGVRSYKSLEGEVGVSKTMLNDWVRQHHDLRVATLSKIAQWVHRTDHAS